MWFFTHILKIEICRQFIKFCLVGTMNAVIDYIIYLFLTRYLNLYFFYANIVAILVAMSSSFVFNKFWTFRNHEKAFKKQTVKFFLVNIVYFCLNNSIVFSLVHWLAVYDLAAKLIAIFIGMFWNFFANKFWTFRKKSYLPLQVG